MIQNPRVRLAMARTTLLMRTKRFVQKSYTFPAQQITKILYTPHIYRFSIKLYTIFPSLLSNLLNLRRIVPHLHNSHCKKK